jgi:hypothetical protein
MRYKIYEGGNRRYNGVSQMLPSGTNPPAQNAPYSYADHQRERSYGVTRHLSTVAPTNSGGNGGTDQALICFLRDNPLVVGDELDIHLLLPNTVLKAVSIGINKAMPGFSFSLEYKNATQSIVANVDAGVVPVNLGGAPLATYVPITDTGLYAVDGSGAFIPNEDYITLTVLTLPPNGIVIPCGGGGLDMWVTAHVLDLNHGNQ